MVCAPLLSIQVVYLHVFALILTRPVWFPSFPMGAAFAVRYLILNYDVPFPHCPDRLRLTQGLPVDQSLEGYVNFSNCIFYERGICCPDRETESICAYQAQVEG